MRFVLFAAALVLASACADVGSVSSPAASDAVSDGILTDGSVKDALGDTPALPDIAPTDHGPPDPGVPFDPGGADPGVDAPNEDAPNDEVGLEDAEDAPNEDVPPPDVDEDTAPDVEDVPDATPSPLACTPCAPNDECDGLLCIDYGADGAYCGKGCAKFVCNEAAEGKQTICLQVNVSGVCAGVRTCTKGKLIACSASVPGPEKCNGIDDDCDGTADEGWPDVDDDDLCDIVDPDDDGDGIPDTSDNCPLVADVSQADLDGDGIGDACDPDIDGDGLPNSSDCAPFDASATGSGVESCNGTDDDCDGATDEDGALGCTVYFTDGDGDGYGPAGEGTCSCAKPGGIFAVVGGDCNDADEDAFPGAMESCNGQDDDCDGATDEPVSAGCTIWYYDGDGDGWYADGAPTYCLCQPGDLAGYAANMPGDCDDAAFGTHPGAVEICNGKDENCDLVIDPGCDDDGDNWCDASMDVGPPSPPCVFGGGDCQDKDQDVHPNAEEICDGKDTNCDPTDNANEGTVLACGPLCAPCPVPPPGDAYECAPVEGGTACLIACAEGKFCSDCTCDGASVLTAGDSVSDARVLYDPIGETFRVAYVKAGAFRLRSFGTNGTLGDDVSAVPGVSKWTTWGVAENTADATFVFAWTSYPDSSIRVGVANLDGTPAVQSIVVEDLPGALARQDVQLGWNGPTKTFLVTWDETGALGYDLHGALLGPDTAPLGPPFELVGGLGDQARAALAPRAGDKGYVMAYANETAAGSPPRLRFLDHSGATADTFELTPDLKPSTGPDVWYEPFVDRGAVQWLGADDQYHVAVFGEKGTLGAPLEDMGGPVGAVTSAPKVKQLRLFYLSGGKVRLRTVDATTGDVVSEGGIFSQDGTVVKVIGGATHPSGYSIVFWTAESQLRARLIGPK